VAVTDYAYDDLDRLIRVTENLPAGEGGNRVTETAYLEGLSVSRHFVLPISPPGL
jgi:hypothetical protein